MSFGALTATIVDTAYEYGIKVYSVDTRSWKAQIVGTSKGIKGDDPKAKKIPTMRFVKKLGFEVDDDAADSGCIALYGFTKNQKLKEEH
jgi:hypothetical protein